MKKALSCQTPGREGSPTALRGAPEAWWAGAAPRPFGGSQSGGGLPPREERKKENRQPKGGMGERHAATTQGF